MNCPLGRGFTPRGNKVAAEVGCGLESILSFVLAGNGNGTRLEFNMVARAQKWLGVLILVLLGGIVVLVIIDSSPTLPAVMILPPGPLVVKSGRVPDRWVPPKWIWLRKACLFVLGQARQVGFELECIEAHATVAAILAQNSLGPPQAESNGVAVWMLADRKLRAPKDPATTITLARVSTSDQGQATVGFGDYQADLCARLERNTLDLSTRLIAASAKTTNFVAAARVQIPYGQTLFVLDVRQAELETNRFAFLITADEYDNKGNKIHGSKSGK
jgi:hypothetical protein